MGVGVGVGRCGCGWVWMWVCWRGCILMGCWTVQQMVYILTSDIKVSGRNRRAYELIVLIPYCAYAYNFRPEAQQ